MVDSRRERACSSRRSSRSSLKKKRKAISRSGFRSSGFLGRFRFFFFFFFCFRGGKGCAFQARVEFDPVFAETKACASHRHTPSESTHRTGLSPRNDVESADKGPSLPLLLRHCPRLEPFRLLPSTLPHGPLLKKPPLPHFTGRISGSRISGSRISGGSPLSRITSAPVPGRYELGCR